MAELGMNAFLYRGAAVSSVATVGYSGTVVNGVVDVNLNGSVLSSFDTTTREDIIGTDDRGKPKFSVTFTLENRAGAISDIDALRSAFVNNTEISMGVLDRPIANAGSRGLISNMKVHNFTRGEPLGDRQTYDVEVRPSSFPGYKNP